QPGIKHLYNTKNHGDVILIVASRVGIQQALPWQSFYNYLRDHWKQRYQHVKPESDFETFWTEALQSGGLFQPGRRQVVRLTPGVLRRQFELPTVTVDTYELTLIPYPSATFYDGRMANRPWLQELPDPLTQIVWDSWVEINPKDAQRLEVSAADLLTLGSLT